MELLSTQRLVISHRETPELRYSTTTHSATSAHISHGTGRLLGMGQAAMASRVEGGGATVKDSLTVRPCSLVAGAVAMRAMACWEGVVGHPLTSPSSFLNAS